MEDRIKSKLEEHWRELQTQYSCTPLLYIITTAEYLTLYYPNRFKSEVEQKLFAYMKLRDGAITYFDKRKQNMPITFLFIDYLRKDIAISISEETILPYYKLILTHEMDLCLFSIRVLVEGLTSELDSLLTDHSEKFRQHRKQKFLDFKESLLCYYKLPLERLANEVMGISDEEIVQHQIEYLEKRNKFQLDKKIGREVKSMNAFGKQADKVGQERE